MLIALVEPFTFFSIVFGPPLLVAMLMFSCAAHYEMKVRHCPPIRKLRDACTAAQRRYREARMYGVLPSEADVSYRTACFHVQEALAAYNTDAELAVQLANKGLAQMAAFHASMDQV